MTTVKFAKVKPEAIIPSKREEDAGFDIYACFEEDYMLLPSHQTVMIPTGIASACDKEYCLLLKERGSTGSKGLGLRAGVIDSGYRNEWFVAITNHNNYDYYIAKDINKVPECTHNGKSKTYPYEKAIAQALLVPVPVSEVEEISYDELKSIASERGEGKLGSSNK